MLWITKYILLTLVVMAAVGLVFAIEEINFSKQRKGDK